MPGGMQGRSAGAGPAAGARAAGVEGMRIAVVNWRDPWHPQAGGAERYAWEMSRGLVRRGARVRYLTARAPGQARSECRDGIGIVRLGGRFTVYPLVLGWLLAHRGSFDAVLDCQNGIPFFTPWVLPRRVPVLCVMHHVHDTQFGVHFPRWMALAGRLLEGPVARRAYRRHACVAVSPSTVAAMRTRLRWSGDIYLIPNGSARAVQHTDAESAAGHVKSGQAMTDRAEPGPQRPSLVWVGRLVAHKRAERLLDIAGRLRGTGATIDVVGRGPAADRLASEITARGLGDVVRLRGFLPEADKQSLVAGALLHLNTSRGEGWGLCVIEAAALGVPTVAYDVDGLRDAVRDGETGWLVCAGERIEDVAERAVKELSDPGRRGEITAACRAWASQFGWERSAERLAALLGAAIERGTARGGHPGAWVMGFWQRGTHHTVVAEGPVRDIVAERGSRVEVLRPAEPLERLLGRVIEEAGHSL
jgi:glycosyltransferase involved in cell wall biosynthesis